jgi:hypothetical protein
MHKPHTTTHLQERAALPVNRAVEARHQLLLDVALHLESVGELPLRLHRVGHVDERLAEVDGHHLLVRARHLKRRPVQSRVLQERAGRQQGVSAPLSTAVERAGFLQHRASERALARSNTAPCTAHLPTAQPRSSARRVLAPCLAAQRSTSSPHFAGKSSASAKMPVSATKSANAPSTGPKCSDRYLACGVCACGVGQAAAHDLDGEGQRRASNRQPVAAAAAAAGCCCSRPALTATSGSPSRSSTWWPPA